MGVREERFREERGKTGRDRQKETGSARMAADYQI
jgi:hypothetical protein